MPHRSSGVPPAAHPRVFFEPPAHHSGDGRGGNHCGLVPVEFYTLYISTHVVD